MQITPITYNTKTNINHKGSISVQELKKLWLFDTDHRLSLLEKKEIRGIDKPKNLKVVDELFKVFEGETDGSKFILDFLKGFFTKVFNFHHFFFGFFC